jgi:DNA-binding GntR family transcriptional regulator
VDEKQVIHKLRLSRTPFREAIGILAKGGLVEIRPYRGFYVRSFSRDETADIYELFKRLQCFAVKLAMPLMSDRDIDGFENILLEGVVALQRGDVCLPSTACNRADSGTSQSKRAEIVRPAAGVANASMPGSLLTSIG